MRAHCLDSVSRVVAELTAEKRINLQTGEMTLLSKHDAPVRCVVYSRDHG